MQFTDYLAEFRADISIHLKKFLDKKRQENLPDIFKEQKLLSELESFSLRGKLVRGSLFLLTCQMLGHKIDDELLSIACGIELTHSALLIQDDVIDRDYQRRGAKTIFAKYEDDGKALKATDPYHYGVSTAFVVGDLAFFLAIELISKFSKNGLGELLKYFSHEIYLVALAESVDSLFGQTDKEPSRDEIYSVYKYKTARYTFSLPFELGAIVADLDDDTRVELGKFGELIGILYQLKDDEMGLFGKEEEIGKPVGGDIREDKKTYIRHLLFQEASGSDLESLKNCFGNEKLSEKGLNEVRDLYKKYKIAYIISAETTAVETEARDLLYKIKITDEFKKLLRSILKFTTERSS